MGDELGYLARIIQGRPTENGHIQSSMPCKARRAKNLSCSGEGPVKVLWLRVQDMDPRLRGGDDAQQRLVMPAESPLPGWFV
jgi:hypothetical protein